MSNIAPPSYLVDHPDFVLTAEEALDDAIQDIIDQATKAGWDGQEVIEAINRVAAEKRIANDPKSSSRIHFPADIPEIALDDPTQGP